jgi:hypothetical protein
MNKLYALFALIVTLQACTPPKISYLENNRHNLNAEDFQFPQQNFNILGFGGYHGSAKTEEVELQLLKTLSNSGTINYYLPETDFSIAYYFNKYLKTGDSILLKDLIIHSGIRVQQEQTIELYEKWKQIKKLNEQLPESHQIEVVGIDYQISYKYVSKHVLELLDSVALSFPPIDSIKNMVETDTTSFALGDLSYAHHVMQNFVTHYERNKAEYKAHIYDLFAFQHIIHNLKSTFSNKVEREQVMYDNYLALSKAYDFTNKPQFLRMGFSHIEKSREGEDGYPYFFTRLIENNIYTKEKVLSAICYFTNSEVVWDQLYDEQGNYTSFTIEGGYGIGDYEDEYFLGIQNLKDTKLSDKTLFRLNAADSPYLAKEPDLIEIVMTDHESNGAAVKGMSTLDFIDYAILISDSKASTPIFEMK